MIRTISFLAAAAAALLSGCDGEPIAKWEPDQELRAKLFKDCMSALPAGPVATKYNDWDEVVAECGNQAYYQSLRKVPVL